MVGVYNTGINWKKRVAFQISAKDGPLYVNYGRKEEAECRPHPVLHFNTKVLEENTGEFPYYPINCNLKARNHKIATW